MEPPLVRACQPGGRKQAANLDLGLRPALLAVAEPAEQGDPMSPLRWMTRSTRNLAAGLTRQCHRVGADIVGGLLRAGGRIRLRHDLSSPAISPVPWFSDAGGH